MYLRKFFWIFRKILYFKGHCAIDQVLLDLKLFVSFSCSQFKDIIKNDESESGLIKNDCLLPFKPALDALGPINVFSFRLFVIHIP